jgi:GNAT superfamily N-acetyltransferase
VDVVKPAKIQHGTASCKLGYCVAVPAHLRGGLLEITKVYVPAEDRGKGLASEMIAKICLQADADRFILLTMPQPYGDGAMSKDELSRWYIRRFGFEVLQDTPVLLLVRRWQATSSQRLTD